MIVKPKKFSFFVEEIKEDVGKKDLEYYLRNDRKYTQAEKEEYKRLKAEQEKEILENDEWQKGDWEYFWNADGSLRSVKLPNGDLVQYEYDALGRRTKKIVDNKIKRYLWDGNVLLHEWEYDVKDEPKRVLNELGEISFDRKEPVNNLVTWVYEDGSFVPIAKIVNDKVFSVISDYLGTPIQAYDQNGNLIWERELDIYGQTRKEKGISNFVPFRYQGQYYDEEINICYNRFRYYNPETGLYISKDPIGLSGGLNVYAYVFDSNTEVDIFGLYSDLLETGIGHHLLPRSIAKKLGIAELMNKNSIAWYPKIGEGTATLHKELHQKLRDFNLPYHGSKYTGTIDDAFEKALKAYDGFETLGFLKLPGTTTNLFENLTPKQALEKIKELYDQKKIPCN